MKLIKLAITLSLASIFFTSCEKEKEPIDVTKRAYLHARAWNMIEHLYTTNVDEETPLYTDELADAPPCTFDDFFFFTTKSEGVYSDYFVRCDASLPEQFPVFLNISPDDKIITVYSNPDDVGGSILLHGFMETPHIDTFKVTYRYWDETTEKNHEVIKKFAVTYPSDI